MAMMSALRERKLLLSATANDARNYCFPEAWHPGSGRRDPFSYEDAFKVHFPNQPTHFAVLIRVLSLVVLHLSPFPYHSCD